MSATSASRRQKAVPIPPPPEGEGFPGGFGEFSSEDLAVDIEAVARHLGMDQPGSGYGPSWHIYAGAEQEILVRNPEGRVIIRPEDEVGQVWQPVIGEQFLDAENEPRSVEAFIGVNETGSFRVRSGDQIFTMDPYDGFWCVTADPEHCLDEISI